jgi:hypothetical protein
MARRLHANGTLGDDDINAMAAEVEASGDPDGLGHQLRCILVRAQEPTQSEWLADRARRRFSVIDGGEA